MVAVAFKQKESKSGLRHLLTHEAKAAGENDYIEIVLETDLKGLDKFLTTLNGRLNTGSLTGVELFDLTKEKNNRLIHREDEGVVRRRLRFENKSNDRTRTVVYKLVGMLFVAGLIEEFEKDVLDTAYQERMAGQVTYEGEGRCIIHRGGRGGKAVPPEIRILGNSR